MRKLIATTFVFAMLCLCTAPAWAQNVIQVDATQDAILDAIAEAQPGDIIELTEGGVVYNNSDELRIEVPLTIRAADGLSERPILYNNGTDGTKDVIRLYNSLRLEGIEIDGMAPDSTIKYAIRSCDETNCAVPEFDLFVIDSYIHDIVDGSDGNALRIYGGAGSGPGGEYPFADSIVFRNTNIHNTGKQAIRVGLESGYSDLAGFGFYNANYFEFTNGTITDSRNEAIGVYGGGIGGEMGEGTVVRINHLTCNNCGYDGSRAVYAWDAYDTVVKNSVFTNTPTGDYVIRLYGPEAYATYIDTMNVAAITAVDGARVEEPVFSVDPMYVDADAPAAELAYAEGSPVRDMADDGLALGDVRLAGQDPTQIGTAIEQVGTELPERLALQQNYPNPFNPATTIPFELEKQGTAMLTVYDMLGRAVKTLVNEQLAAGSYKVTFHADGLASGMYLYVLDVDGQQVRRNMVLMK